MKLLFAIVNGDDSNAVATNLVKNGFYITKMASTGGFLKKGNATFITVVDDEKLDEAFDIIRQYSKKRTYTTVADPMINTPGTPNLNPIEVTIGGATVFVANIERFERM